MESKTGSKRPFFEGVSADIVEGLAAVHWGAGFESCFGLVHVEFGGQGNEFGYREGAKQGLGFVGDSKLSEADKALPLRGGLRLSDGTAG